MAECARRIELYPFEFFDEVRRRWISARYRAELEVIAVRYERFRITGTPEIREVGDPDALTAAHLARGPASK